ncbi:hypothetical protein [Phyllobacterium meliloti]|uniref:hypothetical protein n=1 Tax=Phyllobacterium meliloti TaxID=555317 RepID=UPI001D153519|nr:hypothetical protein [Phyllobacterium sp. T1293]UGX87125.1 hypothetical protein LLE53_004570 [Phyllobacterium sp. T1293]
MKKILIVSAMLIAAPSVSFADAVSDAYKVCESIDATGMSSQKCEVSGWNSSITAVIDMSSGEARKLCVQMAEMIKAKGAIFEGKWTLNIKSPYSGDNTIAFCKLR